MRNYDHKKIEKKWQKKWQSKKIYKTGDPASSKASRGKKKFYILDMFPYPSGEGLHVGHPKGYIATDIVSRTKRMQGFNVLHPMGFDAFGLPAENYALKTKTHPEIAVKKNIARYKKQLEMIGLDYDWSREVQTTDPKYYKWTQWIFLKLLEEGLAYESYEPINWCPSCKTGLSNEDVENGKCERCGTLVEKRPMRQWVLKITKYADRMLKDLDSLDWPEHIKESQRNWIGRSEGTAIKFIVNSRESKIGEVEVFTTRADTLFGATYLVLAPESKVIENLKLKIENWEEVEKYINQTKNKTEIERTDLKKEKTGVEIRGVKAVNPANGEEIPIWVADYVLAHYGTGAVMAVPAHDDRDFEFAKKYNLSIKQVIMPDQLDEKNPPREGKENTERNTVHVILRDPRNNTVLVEFLKGEKWEGNEPRNFIIGGVEEGESEIDTAFREVKEETGYTNVKFVEKISFETQARFFANHKGVNRKIHVHTFVFDLLSDEKTEITEDEYFNKDSHEYKWIPHNEITNTITIPDDRAAWKHFLSGGFAFTGEGVVINSGEYNGLDSGEARKKITEKFGKKQVKYKLRDWVFSRQRYWGEPIPVLHGDGGEIIPVPEKELPVKLPKVKSYEPTGTGESPLAGIKNWLEVRKGGKILKRETNTMPQWAGSSWYYLRYMDPKNNKKLVDPRIEKYWNSVDFYVGGAEHATRHLIYARFWHKFLYDLGVVSTKEPFKKLQSVGLIMGSDGRKMSKRFGNIVNPDDIIKTWGADTLRMYEMFMGPFTDTIAWNTDNMVGVRRFLEKVWRLQFKVQEGASKKELDSLLHKTIKKVSEDIEEMKLNTAISSMMIFVNEMEKKQVLPKATFGIFLKLLAPFAPYMTEEIWAGLGNKSSIHTGGWPVYDKSKIKEGTAVIVVQVNGKVRAQFEAEAGLSEPEAKERALNMPEVKKWLQGEVRKVVFVPNKILNFVV